MATRADARSPLHKSPHVVRRGGSGFAVSQLHTLELVNDRAPLTRLDLLRFLERVQERDLARTRGWITDEERYEAERIRGEQARPPAPDWLIEQGLDGRAAVYVHRGDCHMAGKRSRGITQEQARQALHERVDGCPHCRPDTELGVLE